MRRRSHPYKSKIGNRKWAAPMQPIFSPFAARAATRALSKQTSGGRPIGKKFPDFFNARLQSGVVTAPISNRYDSVGKQTVH
jgi:hypothetical protein